MARLWEHVKVGAPPAFSNPDEMWARALEYFKWCEDNPIQEGKVFNNQGEILPASIPHMRAMTQAGLCAFLNIGVSTWHDYKKKPEFSEVTAIVESVMFEQKFSGAACGMLSANIIARDLGLVDKSEKVVTLNDDFDALLEEAVSDDES